MCVCNYVCVAEPVDLSGCLPFGRRSCSAEQRLTVECVQCRVGVQERVSFPFGRGGNSVEVWAGVLTI